MRTHGRVATLTTAACLRTIGPVRSRRAIVSGLAVAAFTLAVGTAHAQLPVCAALGPDERVQVVCAPFSLFPAVRFLADFTVDQLFKPAPPPIQRTLLEAGQLFAAKAIGDNPDLESFLAALAPLRFTQLDRTTGSLLAVFDQDQREFEGRLEGVEGEPTLTLHLPRSLQGGYWRGPDVLQIALWEKQRIALRIAREGGGVFEGDVDCLALSADGLLVRFSPSTTAPLLVLFRECPQ